MASNQILKKVVLGNIQKASHRFVLEAAIETQTFRRSEEFVSESKTRLISIIEKSDVILPSNTARAVVR